MTPECSCWRAALAWVSPSPGGARSPLGDFTSAMAYGMGGAPQRGSDRASRGSSPFRRAPFPFAFAWRSRATVENHVGARCRGHAMCPQSACGWFREQGCALRLCLEVVPVTQVVVVSCGPKELPPKCSPAGAVWLARGASPARRKPPIAAKDACVSRAVRACNAGRNDVFLELQRMTRLCVLPCLIAVFPTASRRFLSQHPAR